MSGMCKSAIRHYRACPGVELTNSRPLLPFYSPWKYQETFGFRFSGVFRGYKVGKIIRNALNDQSHVIIEKFCLWHNRARVGADDDVITRITKVWSKFRDWLVALLASKGLLLGVKGKLYSVFVRSFMLYGSERVLYGSEQVWS